jgi:hypothetical protein
MRKKFWIPLTLIGAAAIGFFGFLPGYVEDSMNAVDGQPLIKVSDEAKALHKRSDELFREFRSPCQKVKRSLMISR